MLSSMTGFATAETNERDFDLVWEIRSVNHRFLDASFRLPEEFRRFEPEFKMMVKDALGRGKVECTLRLNVSRGFAASWALQEEALEFLRRVEKNVLGKFPDARPLSVAEILRWPGVAEETQNDFPVGAQGAAEECLNRALIELCISRQREGERISVLVEERRSMIRGILSEVRPKLGKAEVRYRKKLLKRLDRVDVAPNPERLEQELVLLAQRLDVTEELDRLEGHTEEIENVLTRSEPVGRRMDFLIQELNREANTLTSKFHDEELIRLAVELKVFIEQMREQVQNLE